MLAGLLAGQVLRRVNELILGDNRSPLFLSALYAILNVETGELQYASAGHGSPLCWRRKSGLVEELPAQGYVLGAFGDAAFSDERAALGLAGIAVKSGARSALATFAQAEQSAVSESRKR